LLRDIVGESVAKVTNNHATVDITFEF